MHENEMKLQVTAAIIKQENNYLICQRAEDDECPMLWEFPGGKLEKGETLEQCIIREMAEELDLAVEIQEVFAKTVYHFNQKEIPFTFFSCIIIGGTMTLNVHHDAKWVTAETLKEYRFMPADIEIVKKIQKGA